MARALLCIVLVLGLVGCSDDEDPRVAALTADLREARDRVGMLRGRLDEARERATELERDLLHRSDLDRARFVDLWYGGPTLGGPFLALPRLGVLRWTCDEARRFRIGFEGSSASVDVRYRTPERARSRMVHPGSRMIATLGPSETVAWTITHRHKPGFIRARVDVTTQRSKLGGCLLPRVRVEEKARLYD